MSFRVLLIHPPASQDEPGAGSLSVANICASTAWTPTW